MLPMRYVVLGISGSGKTTLARQIAQTFALPHIELDALHWEPSWQMVSKPEFRGRVKAATTADAWVVDGNYSKSRDIVWGRATHLIWLDYSFPRVFRQILWRTLCRVFTQEKLWNDNRESLRHVLARDGIVWWMISTYQQCRQEYLVLLRSDAFSHLTVYRFRKPKDAATWLQAFTAKTVLRTQ